MKDRPIAIFDTGIGGLSVVSEIIKQLPNENIIYLGDTARVPYGSRDPETITHFSIEMLKFLIDENPKMIVVACNTINAICFETIMDISPVPVLGVIEPTIAKALQTTKNGKIGVIGTSATINAAIYEKYIHSMHSSVKLLSQACPLFVPLVEEHWLDHAATYMIAEEYLKPLQKEIDTLILGCTHYPLLEKVIHTILGSTVTIINSGKPTAFALKQYLESKNMLRKKSKSQYTFYVTAISAGIEKSAQAFFDNNFPGELKKVELPHFSNW